MTGRLRCPKVVKWADLSWVEMHCRLPYHHEGWHWDGLCWFDDFGFRVPRDTRRTA